MAEAMWVLHHATDDDTGWQALTQIVVAGTIGIGVYVAVLLATNAPEVGAHLNLLGNYFVGYSVTWPGSLLGLLYGALLGGVAGWSVGKIYNGIVNLRQP